MSTPSVGLTLQRGKIQRPAKAVIYGPEGIGKSTLGAAMPAPVFLDTEGGTDHLDVARFPQVKTWEDVTRAVSQLANSQHEFKTLVVDTVDWLEKRLAEDICRRNHKASIEDFGYGKGYALVAEEFAAFLASLDGLMRNKGMHVVLLAHAMIRRFEQPDAAGSYDRYELKLSKQVGPLVKEWCDLLLFANYFTRVAESDSGRKRGVGGRERVLYTTHTAAWDAKNRHGLEEKLPFTFEAIGKVFGETNAAAIPAPAQPSVGEQLAGLFKGKEAQAKSFLVARGQMKENGSFDDISAEYAARILGNPVGFLDAVEKFHQEGAKTA